jgi:lipopolysaccharide O-acetyltransferase
VIGNGVALNDSVHVAAVDSLEIGNNVLIASKVYISDHDHGRYSGKGQNTPEESPGLRDVVAAPVIIEDNVWVGEFVSILKGVRIGFGSIIGSNSVVTGTIPPRSIAVGAPARVIKQFDPDAKQWIKV